MYGVMRQRITSMTFSSLWVNFFVDHIKAMDLTYENQLTWQKIEDLENNKEEEQNSKKNVKEERLSKKKTVENPAKQICFAFLGKEIGMSDFGCVREDCKSAHHRILLSSDNSCEWRDMVI
jgi:hypothetical protein